MTGKEYLKQIKKIDTQIKNKSVEIRQFEEMGVPFNFLVEKIKELSKARMEITENIERLPEAEYDVLHRVYCQNETLQEVAADRNISYSLAATIHGRALKRLENLINANPQ